MTNAYFTFFFVLVVSGVIAQCEYGAHSTSLNDAWLSCIESSNPNPNREEGHWIMYDLNSPHRFYETRFWNLNTPGMTNQGVRLCAIDVSVDGINWESWGEYEFPQAPGVSAYTGVEGPFLDGVVGRYLLLTVLSNWGGGGCVGFAEIRVGIESTTVSVSEWSALSAALFPNPASNMITVRSYNVADRMMLEVYDLSGREVFSTQMLSSTIRVDVSAWQNGLYFARLRDEKGRSTTIRFMVAH
jgi:hypothetical protein